MSFLVIFVIDNYHQYDHQQPSSQKGITHFEPHFIAGLYLLQRLQHGISVIECQ